MAAKKPEKKPKLKTNTKVKAGGLALNHNQRLR
jgi:hypothetical protein